MSADLLETPSEPLKLPQVLVVAGEASADDHAATLVRETVGRVTWFGLAGRKMREAGAEALVPAERMAIAGLTEVLAAIPRVFGYLRLLAQNARARRPKVALLVDLPDFNLRLAKRLRRLGVPVVYYISPQVWAWRVGRVRAIKQLVDQMLVILPFEVEFYRRHGITAHYVGHPLLETTAHAPNRVEARKLLGLSDGPVLALLPGSRAMEVARHFSHMLESARQLRERDPSLRIVVPIASTVDRETIEVALRRASVDAILTDDANAALAAADAASVCSGTATLQAGLLMCPMVVVYRVSWLTHWILRRLVKVQHIGLVNLVAERALATELIQNAFTPERLSEELEPLLYDTERRRQMVAALGDVRLKLKAVSPVNPLLQHLEPYWQANENAR